MKKTCIICGRKEGLFSKNYAAFDVKSYSGHPFPDRIEELVLPGDRTNDYLCEKCASKFKIKCKEHGIIENEAFTKGTPPICAKCSEEKENSRESQEKPKTVISSILPKIKYLVTTKVGPAARNAVNDETKMKFVVNKIYTFLPSPIRLIFSEEKFFMFCWDNRFLIFGDKRNENIYPFDESDIVQDNANNELSEDEKEYIEDIQFMLDDDGKVDEDERKILENKRKEFRIEEKRAKEIELSTFISEQHFTPEESTYINEIKTYLKDGKIDERPREILERRRIKFDISEERATELEEYCKTSK